MKKLLVVLAIITLSCKSETKDTSVAEDKVKIEAPKAKELIVKIDFKSNVEDELKLMLNNVVFDEFQRKNIHIIEKVIPGSDVESLTANFGENFSNDFQFSLGNKVVKEVEIISMSLSYGDNAIQITPENINDYIAVNNKYVSYDAATGLLKTKKVDGKHFPTLIMRRKTLNQLKGDK